jgi:hypothetical protein
MRIEARSKGRITITDDQRLVLDHARVHDEDYSGRKLIAIRLGWISFARLPFRSNSNSVSLIWQWPGNL